MANERISMRKIKEALRLRFGVGLSRTKTARSLGIGKATVGEYEARFKASNLPWPLPETLNDAALEAQLFKKQIPETPLRPAIPFDYLAKEMKRPNVTLMLLWEEYKRADPSGYQYSQFAKRYRDYQKTLPISMHQDHKAGEKLFVDYGDGLWIRDAGTGTMIPVSLFVAVWGASNYLFARATPGEDLRSWIDAHVKCFEFCGCAPKSVVPDNLKSAVTKTCRYEPDVNPTYADLAAHYGLCVFPARPYRPKDKAKVENGVLLAKRWIVARLRNRIFERITDLNEAIEVLVDDFNERPMRKLGTSRKALFLELDQPNALALPQHPFEFSQWKKVRVGINYHVEFERHFYSAPYALIHRELEVRATSSLVQIYKEGQRIFSHPRSFKENDYTTCRDHMPPSHQKYTEWTPERILSWAEKDGPSVRELVEKILASRVFPEQAYRSCLGIIRLANRFGAVRLERACQRALAYSSFNYRSVKNILEKGLDRITELPPEQILIRHENLRGPGYYSTPNHP